MSGNTNSGRGSGPLTRAALLSLLEVHTEGATATELGAYVGRTSQSTREQLVQLQTLGKTHQTPDHLWHLTDPEAAHRSAFLTPATTVNHRLPPDRARGR
jgi:DNA-binding IclR family transcriptional regulator